MEINAQNKNGELVEIKVEDKAQAWKMWRIMKETEYNHLMYMIEDGIYIQMYPISFFINKLF